MRHPSIFARFRRDQEGATIIEFALVATIFFTLMLGVIEYGMIMFTKVAIESATQQSGRTAAIGTGNNNKACDRVCVIRNMVSDKTMGLVSPESVFVTATVVSGSSNAPTVPDICLDDASNPYPPTCKVYENNNGASGYQQQGAINNASVGKAGGLVEIRVTYLWRVLFPLFRSYFGNNGVLTITSTTVVKNEPF